MARPVESNMQGAETEHISPLVELITKAGVILGNDIQFDWNVSKPNASVLTLEFIVPESIDDELIKQFQKAVEESIDWQRPYRGFKDSTISVHKRDIIGTGTLFVSGLEINFPSLQAQVSATVERMFNKRVNFHEIGGTRKRLEETTVVVILPLGFSLDDAERLKEELSVTLGYNVVVGLEQIK